MTIRYITPMMAQVSRLLKVFPAMVRPLLVSSGKPMTERMDVSLRVMMN